MIRAFAAVIVAFGTLGSLCGLRAAAPAPATSIVVELFTSEGCSSCPPADGFLQKLVESQPLAGAQVIALGEHVDYWDQLGWKDRFSSAALTNRQQVYGARFNTDSIYTPQMVVDGRAELVGSDAGAARRALERARTAPHGSVHIVVDDPRDRPERTSVHISVMAADLPRLAGGDRADVVAAITEDHLQSKVTRGENHGRVLSHVAVVRSLSTIGEVASSSASTTVQADIPIAPDWQRSQLKVIAFVQERRGRAILASAVAPVVPR
jgi:hypothetical protein